MNFLQWSFGGLIALLHPFYISMTDINLNTKNKSMEVSVRIFADDFEKTLKKNCNCKLDLNKPANKQEAEKLVNNYIIKHLQLKLDGKVVPMQFVGYETEQGSIWNYFEIKNVTSFKKLELHNSLLHDYNESQVNMLHISANGKDKSEKLDYPKNTYTTNW